MLAGSASLMRRPNSAKRLFRFVVSVGAGAASMGDSGAADDDEDLDFFKKAFSVEDQLVG